MTGPANITTSTTAISANKLLTPQTGTLTVAPNPTPGQGLALDPRGLVPKKAHGVYKNYTPVWTTTGVAPALGNAVVVSRYTALGCFVHYRGIITFGSTSTFGTGNWVFSLPVPATTTIVRSAGFVEANEASTGDYLLAHMDILNANQMYPLFAATYLGVASNVTATAPWTWATNDFISWNVMYESTS